MAGVAEMKHLKRMAGKIACLLLALFLATGTFHFSSISFAEQAPNITIDGNRADFSLTSESGEFYVPADEFYTALGAGYSWDPSNSRAIVEYGVKSFTVSGQDTEININGKSVRLTSKPYIKNNKLMIPLIPAIESIGGGLEWDEASKVWKVYSRNLLEDTADRMQDGIPVKDWLAKYEKYFEDGTYIFWSSLRDGASLYRSDSDGTHYGRMIDSATEVIGLDSDYVYFIDMSQGNSLCRIRKDGTDLSKLSDDIIESAWLDADRIHFFSKSDGLSLYSISKDGSDKRNESADITIIGEDWVIDDSVSVSDKNIFLRGNLIINTSGSLILNNVNMVFDCGNGRDDPAEKSISAESSSISIKNSRISSTHPDGGILFFAASAKVKVESSRLSGVEMELNQCDGARLMRNYIINSAGNGAIRSDESENLYIKDNIIINKDRDAAFSSAIQLRRTKNSGIMNNVFVDQGECISFSHRTSDCAAVNNLIFNDKGTRCLSLSNGSGNNIFKNNFIQMNYDDGYRINDGYNGVGFFSDTVGITSTFEENVINNATNAICIQNLRNCIYDSNRVWLQLTDNVKDRTGSKCLDMRYSHKCEIINNEFDSWLGDNGSGIQLFCSTGSRIEGNSIKGFKYGLELWNASDSNNISGNHVIDCSGHMVIDSSKSNEIVQNSFISNSKVRIYAYNNGENEWASNYYSNLRPKEPQVLYGTGVDNTPAENIIELTSAKRGSITQSDIPGSTEEGGHEDQLIYDDVTWTDGTVDWEWDNIRVMDGGTLTLENIIVNAPVSYIQEPVLIVESGGTLIIKNSRIAADPFGMPVIIIVSEGATIIAENSEFEYMPSFDIMGSGAVINNCTFTGCYGIDFHNSSDLNIQDCRITNSFFGLRAESPDNNKIGGITEENISIKLGDPVREPVAEINNSTVKKEKDKVRKTAYITIDDGPSRSVTPINLDTLKKYGVKATFFVLPRNGLDDIYKRILDEGHVIGNHSYSHDYDYLYSSVENFETDVIKARNFIYKKFGYTTTVYRFPGGSGGRGSNVLNPRVRILTELGYKYFDWNASMADTDPNLKKYGTEEQIVNLLANNILKNTNGKNKLIILMHDSDGKNYSAKALPLIIEGLIEQGYEFDVLTNY